MLKKCNIHNQKGYEKIKKLVERGEKFLEDKWFDSKHEEAVAIYMAMANGMLIWELKTNIFMKEFNEWRLNQ